MLLDGRLITGPGAPCRPGRLVIGQGRVRAIEPLDPDPTRLPVVCPAFIDAHTHPVELGLQELFADVGRAATIDELLQLVADRRAALRPRTMLGFNLEPERLAEKRFPTRAELDRACPGVPCLVYRVDCHSAVLNTAGLALVAPGPSETMERDRTGEPTGLLSGPAYEFASRLFKRRLEPDTVHEALRRAGELALAAGATTIAALVGSFDLEETQWRVLLDGLGKCPARTVPFLQTRDTAVATTFGLGRIGGCVLVDGSFGSHTAALAEDYADRPGQRGSCYHTDAELAAFFGQADKRGLQATVHAIGDRAVEQVVRCYEAVLGPQSPNPLRHRIEHAELLSGPLVERIARLGLVLGVQPAFEARWGGPGGLYARRLGPRWRRTNPYRALRGAGIMLAGGSDAPITPIDPLGGIRAATHHPNPDQSIPGPEALAMFTTRAAFSLGLESELGRLEPGVRADFAVLSADPREDTDCRLIATWRDGRVAWQPAAG